MDNHQPLPPITQTVTRIENDALTEEIQGQSSQRVIDKRQEHSENMDVDESNEERRLGVVLPATPNNQYSNSHSNLSVPSAYRHNDVFSSLDNSETFSSTDFVSSIGLNSIENTYFETNFADDLVNLSINSKPSCSRNMDESLSVLSQRKQKLSSEQLNDIPSVRMGNLANKLIKLSRRLKTPDFENVSCLSCRNLPVGPVTGKCGHTRCMRFVVFLPICLFNIIF